jgi:hypothetical protein
MWGQVRLLRILVRLVQVNNASEHGSAVSAG